MRHPVGFAGLVDQCAIASDKNTDRQPISKGI
jgi:hypothetical protein